MNQAEFIRVKFALFLSTRLPCTGLNTKCGMNDV